MSVSREKNLIIIISKHVLTMNGYKVYQFVWKYNYNRRNCLRLCIQYTYALENPSLEIIIHFRSIICNTKQIPFQRND